MTCSGNTSTRSSVRSSGDYENLETRERLATRYIVYQMNKIYKIYQRYLEDVCRHPVLTHWYWLIKLIFFRAEQEDCRFSSSSEEEDEEEEESVEDKVNTGLEQLEMGAAEAKR